VTRHARWGLTAAAIAGVLLVAAYVALSVWSTLTIKGDFYDALGMGGAYRTRWHATLLLWAIGGVVALLLASPLLLLGAAGAAGVARGPRPPTPGPHPGEDASESAVERWTARRAAVMEWELASSRRQHRRAGALPRLAIVAAWVGLSLVLMLMIGGRLAGDRDLLLASRKAVAFGVSDPIFGRDISFFVFTVPAWQAVAGALLAGIAFALAVIVATGVGLSRAAVVRNHPLRGAVIARRTRIIGLVYGGLMLVLVGVFEWLSRYGLVSGGDDTIAGAGRAVRTVDIPTRTVAAVFVALLGIGLVALVVPAVRARFSLHLRPAVYVGVGIWVAATLTLAVIATPWWILLLIPALLIPYFTVRAAEQDPALAALPVPVLAWAGYAAVTAITLVLLGPAGARFYDAVLLRGSKLQVERSYIGYTLAATRKASGLDQARIVDANYQQNGVTQEAIDAAPASVGSLRFLDAGPTQQACLRLQTFDQFYTCDEVDVDRYTFKGQRRTVFAIGREIDYTKAPDFQRRHFTYTHGYGLILAPVNEIDPTNGRPTWITGDIPQRGPEDPIARPDIYFGAQADVPWAFVNTTQPVFNGPDKNEVVNWTGRTGIAVGSGMHRLALTQFLGGLPYIGGGRQIWNATGGRPAGPGSQVLLYRDILARASELAPFLRLDPDPYFAAAGGHLYVILNAYAATSRYPYAASFDGANYMRNAAVVTVDAYSGETHLYVVDPSEPVTATWRRVYPELFTPLGQMPTALRAHLRYGERLFDYQSLAAERFHVSSVDVFYNNNEAWAPTRELTGAGANGTSSDSPARYTYAVLPGQTSERFVVMRSYKPAARSRGIGFSGWFAVDNEPDAYGKATILRFPSNAAKPLDSLDVFTANVGRDPTLSQDITTRRDAVVRGNTIVVPIGQGLLYTQPLYLDTAAGAGDSLPTLWQVVVSFGDGNVHTASTFSQALQEALDAASGKTGTPATDATLADLVRTAAEEWDAYRKAFGAGDDVAAATALQRFQEALSQARNKAEGGAAASAR
jgi:uncharacterized membrane protein (UPF0182 family)